MRLLPQAFSLLLLLNLCCLLSPAVAQSNQDNKKQLRDLQGRISTLQKDLAQKETSKNEAADALRDSERAISDIQRQLVKLAKQQQNIQAQLAQLQAQSTQLEQQVKLKQEQLGKLIYHQHLTGREEHLPLLLKQQDPNAIMRKLHYYGYLVRARSEHIDTLRDQMLELDALTRESLAKQQKLERIQQAQLSQKTRLEQEKTKRATLLAKLSETIELQRNEITKLRQDEQRLTELIEQINKLLAQRKAAAASARQSSKSPHLRNQQLPDASKQRGAFASLKGKLRLPVRGELVNRFGSPREGSVKWKGLFIRARGGNEVKAIANGRVVFADWLRGFGNLLIVDHGSDYMSLYGNNEAIYKRVGDKVKTGDTIAVVGNSGGNTETGLYFELRYQGKPFDPLTWAKIE
ncbi:murein hydrolase activator EnvC family protein [Nitrosomonas sp. ANs5]|uniref:murein hydrolase activator EnvC family protein n=1 Tax=Nitrosomonas sp. ANs5 TaxID=3423941 RepID=UPI003D32ABFD